MRGETESEITAARIGITNQICNKKITRRKITLIPTIWRDNMAHVGMPYTGKRINQEA